MVSYEVGSPMVTGGRSRTVCVCVCVCACVCVCVCACVCVVCGVCGVCVCVATRQTTINTSLLDGTCWSSP